MKYIIVLADGMADFKVPELGNKTPMEYAYCPNMNYLARNGQVGRMKTIYENLPVGSIVANMAILGFNPYKYYPQGRASFEALAQGIQLNKNDMALRCNLISINEGLRITDFTSGNISDGHAKNIVSHLKINNHSFRIFPGQSYRNLLILRDISIHPNELKFFEPHCNIGRSIHEILPKALSEKSKPLADELSDFMLDTISQIKELNKRFKTKADMIWFWSPSSMPNLPSFAEKFKINGSIVAAMDFLKGIGVSAQMDFEDIPDTNGYIDTNYENKLSYAKKMLLDNDLVYIHINAPDEEGHNRNPHLKAKSIEYIDNRILGPLMIHLREQYQDDFRIAVLPDHYTAVKDGQHYGIDVPFLLYGKDILPDQIVDFSEESAERSDFKLISYNFMEYFLNIK